MKKVLIISSVLILSLALFSQQIREEAIVINIEVPVRVFSGKAFIDNLTIDDFEVLENGVPQDIEAVYFVKKRSVERSQEKKRFIPKTLRNFFLFFELSQYTPQIGDAINYFAHNVLSPGDNLTIITSMKSYRMKNIAFEVTSPGEVAKQLIGLVRRDTLMGNSEYRYILDQMTALAQTLSSNISQVGRRLVENNPIIEEISMPNTEITSSSEYEGASLEEQFNLYESYMFRLEDLRKISQNTLLNFAQYLGEKEGRKYVTIFYQKEFIPQVDQKILNQYLSLYQDRPILLQTISNMIDFYRREIPIDTEKIKQTYADRSISIHFLYITLPQEHHYGVQMEDHSEDIFAAFREMAISTGGYVDSSAMADSLFKRAVEASENYYLLYYAPKSYSADGKFRDIKINIKNKNYRVLHRAGYFAN